MTLRTRRVRAAGIATGVSFLLAGGALLAVAAAPAQAATTTTTTAPTTTTTTLPTVTFPSDSVVLSDDFENGDAGGWSTTAGAAVAVTSGDAHGGTRSLTASGIGTAYRSLAGLGLVPGGYYRVTFSAALAPGSGASRLNLRSAAGYTDNAVLNVPSTAWVTRGYNFQYQPSLPYASDALLFIAASGSGCSNPTAIRIDDLTVTQLAQPAPVGLIEDDFRPCGSGTTTTTTRPTTSTTTTTTTTPAAACELSFTAGATWRGGFTGTVTVTNSGPLDLRSWSGTLGLDGGRIVAAAPVVKLTRTSDGVRFDPRVNASIRSGRSVSFSVVGTGNGTGANWTTCTLVAR